jgi:signal transduction histidine kinase
MEKIEFRRILPKLSDAIFSVPVRIKIIGIMVLPVLIMGWVLNYWVQTGLSDWLSYLLSDERVDVAMQAGSRSVFLVTALSAVASMLLTALLMLTLTKPLLELIRVTERVANGDLASRARIWVQDEIGVVASSVNQMLDRLVSSQQKLERTNRRLEAINRVAVAAGRELNLQDVLDASLKTTLDVFGHQSGWIYMRDPTDPGDTQLQLVSAVAIPPEVEPEIRNETGELCDCKRHLLSDESNTEAHIHYCKRMTSILGAKDFEIFHITIPLEARGQRFGLINAICSGDTKPTENDMDTLTTIGTQISEVVVNAWLHASLKEKEAARQTLLTALVSAQEDERARLARELHDDAGQSLTSLLIRLKTLEKQAPSQEFQQGVADLCKTTSETIEQIREISHRLRPAALEEFGLEVALRTLAEEMFVDMGISAECQLHLGGQRLPFEIETNLYRITQESLTNVIRHSNAKNVRLELVVRSNVIRLCIEDDGEGFSTENVVGRPNRRQLGLMSLQERGEMMGGALVVKSAPGHGTTVEVQVPFEFEVENKTA